jgi:hypothetical protein
VYKLIKNEWKVYRLKKKIQAADTFFNAKIGEAGSPAEADHLYRRKVDLICTIAEHYLQEKNPRRAAAHPSEKRNALL